MRDYENEVEETVVIEKEPLIEWMRDNLTRPMLFFSHDCENCWKRPSNNIVVGDGGIPFQLCDFCKNEYVKLLTPDVRKRLM